MSEFVVVGFDSTADADRAPTEPVRLTKEHLIDLEDAVVAIRSPDGAVGAGSGALAGSLNYYGIDDDLIRSSLSPEQERRRRAALSQARHQDTGGNPPAGSGVAAPPSPGASPAGTGAV